MPPSPSCPPTTTRHPATPPSAVIHQLLSEDAVGQHGEFLIAAKGPLHSLFERVYFWNCCLGTSIFFSFTQNPKSGHFILRIYFFQTFPLPTNASSYRNGDAEWTLRQRQHRQERLTKSSSVSLCTSLTS